MGGPVPPFPPWGPYWVVKVGIAAEVTVNPGGGAGWDESPLDIQIPDDARELDRDVLAYHREQRAQRRRSRLRRLAGPLGGHGTVLPVLASILAVCLVAGAMLSVATFSPTTAPGMRTHPATTAATTGQATTGRATNGQATTGRTATGRTATAQASATGLASHPAASSASSSARPSASAASSAANATASANASSSVSATSPGPSGHGSRAGTP